MIRFTALGAYLLVVTHGMALIRNIVLLSERAIFFFFEKQQNVRNKALVFIYKGTITETVKVIRGCSEYSPNIGREF